MEGRGEGCGQRCDSLPAIGYPPGRGPGQRTGWVRRGYRAGWVRRLRARVDRMLARIGRAGPGVGGGPPQGGGGGPGGGERRGGGGGGLRGRQVVTEGGDELR